MTATRCRAVLRIVLPVLAVLLAHPPAAAQLPASSLRIGAGHEDTVWWRAADAPTRWAAADPAVLAAVRWEQL